MRRRAAANRHVDGTPQQIRAYMGAHGVEVTPGPLQPLFGLAQVAAHHPEPPQCQAQPRAQFRLAVIAAPRERRAQVVVLALELIEYLNLLRAGQSLTGRLGETERPHGLPHRRRLTLTALDQLLE